MANPGVDDNLIFDLGVHKGYDTEYYLKKGFRVVGLEAVPELWEHASQKVQAYGDRVTLLNKALYYRAGETVSFFSVPGKDDWGSLEQAVAEKGVETAVEIKVETIDLAALFDRFGTPHYIKCDMEGGDLIFRDQLAASGRHPTFVSIEMNDGKEGEVMKQCGYDRAQIVNQWMHPFKKPPQPAREGTYVEAAFNGEMSGLFGRELNPSKWRPIDEVADIYRQWFHLRMLDEELAPGWVDLHVCRSEALR